MVAPNYISGQFNKNVTLLTGTVKLKKDGVLYQTFTQQDIVITGSSFSIDVTNLLTQNGEYQVSLSGGLFLSEIQELSSAFSWNFIIKNADYSSADYSSSDYLIN